MAIGDVHLTITTSCVSLGYSVTEEMVFNNLDDAKDFLEKNNFERIDTLSYLQKRKDEWTITAKLRQVL